MDRNTNITLITPDIFSKSVDLKEVWRYRDLIKLLFKRNIKVQYRQTVFGPLWIIVNPLMTSVVFTFVFGGFAKISTGGVPHMLFYLMGTGMWNLFSSSLNLCAGTFRDNQSTYGKVYYPRLTVPISQALTCIFNFIVVFGFILLFQAFYALSGEVSFKSTMLLVPLLALQSACLGSSAGIIISSLATKYKDLLLAVTFLTQLWMYATPIVYPLADTGGWMYRLLLVNPMTPIIENFRYFMIGAGRFLGGWWALSWVVTLALLYLSLRMFRKTEKTFIDVI
ncbi:MAG: ABC transporter permease [Oscillospiraceae bacterium]|nr:ABC transporter permease [Oscillospiraceae bacterium]